jgi:hypothetical protein
MGQVLGRLKRPLSMVTLVASLAACGTAGQRQYQTAVSVASEECRALQAVVEERERYGIITPSSDEGVLRSCGLPPYFKEQNPHSHRPLDPKISR